MRYRFENYMETVEVEMADLKKAYTDASSKKS